MERQIYDTIVIGGGVIGVAVARELGSCGQSVALVEKEADLLAGASSGNTGHLGSNFYYTAARGAPLEAEMTAEARRINPSWLSGQPSVPVITRGMIYLARGTDDELMLEKLLQLGRQNGVNSLHKKSLAELAALEPKLNLDGVTSGLFSEEESIVDPWLLAMTHVYGCEVAGVDIYLNCCVNSVSRQKAIWHVNTTQGQLASHMVINCAGNYGDKIDRMWRKEAGFRIRPGKGEYLVFGRDGSGTINRPIVPMPTKATAGVYVFETVYGHTVVGPTNVRQDSLEDRSTSVNSISDLYQHIHSLFPEASNWNLLGTYAGLRPATEHQDYCVNFYLSDNWITVGGIRSTGLTCSLALSRYVAAKIIPKYQPAELPQMPRPMREGDKVKIGGKLYRPTHPLSALGLVNISYLQPATLAKL